MAKAPRKAKAAPRAPQAFSVVGVDEGTATVTVESTSDATKKDTVTIEVVDIGVNVASITGDIFVGVAKEVSCNPRPDKATATIAWDVGDYQGEGSDRKWVVDESKGTVVPDGADPKKAMLTPLTTSYARCRAVVTYEGLSFEDASGFTAAEEPVEKQPS